ncbi:hypothetical protein GN244_ATG10310 [Phytophthora infestans]|uniref:Uncharacterized protein n=1 Tax=Phytophthora infestans TaxID=4787 RepID=A0A833S971_PHYIN|nr:hypothetical protein GN244_ATG10310 [Phytophthora infestans]
MGTSVSRSSPLAPTFERMSTWDLKASRGLLQTYKDKDMDFGLDSQRLADLVGGDKDWAEGIIDAFRSHTGIINALAFICGACLVSSGPALEKAGVIFDALDFDGTEQISMDEMTISLLCCARGVCIMAGVGTFPSDEELETVTLQAYRELNKTSSQSITKSEFTKWILEFASGTEAHLTREVTLQNALEQFRVLPPTDKVEDKEGNNDISAPPQPVDDTQDSLLRDELTPTNELPVIQQGVDVTPEKNDTDQLHTHIDEDAELVRPVELAFISPDEQVPSGIEVPLDEHETKSEETEQQNLTQIDNNDEGEVNALELQSDDTGLTIECEEQPITRKHFESGDSADVPPVAGSDYPTFVADADEQHDSTSAEELPSKLPKVAENESSASDLGDLQDNASSTIDPETQNIGPVDASQELLAEIPSPEPTATKLENDELVYEHESTSVEELPTELPGVAEKESSASDLSVPQDNASSSIDPETQQTEPADASQELQAEPTASERENDDLVYEQDAFEQSGDDEDKDDQHAEYREQTIDTPIELAVAAEMPVVTPIEREPEVSTTQDAVDNEPNDGAQEDLNAFDTYDYQDPRFDGSSGVAPPSEPQDLLDDNATMLLHEDLADAPAE